MNLMLVVVLSAVGSLIGATSLNTKLQKHFNNSEISNIKRPKRHENILDDGEQFDGKLIR